MTKSTSIKMDKTATTHKQWYVLSCQRGGLTRAKLHLQNQGIEYYNPEINIEKIIRNKKQVITEPLFPGYMFIALPLTHENEPAVSMTAIRSTRGVKDFVRSGVNREPAKIALEVILSIKHNINNEQVAQQSRMPKEGQEVYIKNGPFNGINAIYKEADGEKRSFLLINIINQPTSTSIENKNIEWL